MKPELHDTNYWINRPMDSEKDWIDDEENWIESYVASVEHPHRQMIVNAVRELYPVSVLEVGCNVGSNLIRLREMFPSINIAGIDVNEKCIKKAKEYLNRAILKIGNYLAIPFNDKSFDVVLADAVLMYANPKEMVVAMEELDRVARRGIIIVDRVNKSRKGIRNGHVWARNYPRILKDWGYEVEITKITEDLWPDSEGWAKFGYLIVGTKREEAAYLPSPVMIPAFL